jgi:predicted nucleic acid-binding protein
MRRFFDTSVLVYAYDAADEAKRAIARSLIQEAIAEASFVVSTQVLAEFYSTVARGKLIRPERALDLVRNWAALDAVPQTPDLVVRGIALHQQHSLALWDALIVQAALDASCLELVTEDMQHGRRFGELEIVNPFLAGSAHERAAPYRATGKRARSRRPVRPRA